MKILASRSLPRPAHAGKRCGHAPEMILAPGGVFVITTPNAENLEILHTLCPACNSTFHIWQYVRSWNRETLGATLSHKGFQPVQVLSTRFESRLVRLAFWASGKLRRAPSQPPHLLGMFRRPS